MKIIKVWPLASFCKSNLHYMQVLVMPSPYCDYGKCTIVLFKRVYSLHLAYDIEELYNTVIYDRAMKLSITPLLSDIRFFIFFNLFEDTFVLGIFLTLEGISMKNLQWQISLSLI